MPRNPSGDAGPDVVPSSASTSTGGGERSGGPKRPPRPKAPAAGGAPRTGNRSKKKKPSSSNGATTSTTSTKRVSASPVGPPPAGFAGSNPSPAVATAPTAVQPGPAATRSADKARRARPSAEPVVERTTGNRRGRRVTRVVRRIELWSVLKLSLVLFTCLYLAVLGTLVVVWGVAYSSGQVERLQEFLADVGLENFRFYGDRMFKAVAAIGAVVVLAGTILAVLTTALINVISEMTGGIRVVVIEEEPSRR